MQVLWIGVIFTIPMKITEAPENNGLGGDGVIDFASKRILIVEDEKLLNRVIAKKLKLDPAIMASPLITTIVDTCSILIYFAIAVAIMNI